MSEIKLSDSTSIPPGQTIQMPSGPMARDRFYYDDPKKLDGDHFYRKMAKGQEGEQPSGNEYAGIKPGSLNLGLRKIVMPRTMVC